MNRLPDNVQKYLSKYGNEKWKIQRKGNLKYDAAIVIPAIAEYSNLIPLLDSLTKNNFNNSYDVLVILVVNNLISSSPEVKKDNQKTLSFLKAFISNDTSFHPLISKINSSGFSLGFIDAASAGLEMPEKTGGVGLARKIGMDLALTIFDCSKPNKKILICLDADCMIEKNYIHEIITSFNNFNMNVAVINYEHPLPEDDESLKAIICYEIFLRYYELGLRYADSHYAFQAVGSAMTCDYEAYIKVEGMNKQKAAEDFYFLEKLAKHYTINKINSTTVYPSARKSWRVPFGTGQRINRFFSKTQNEYLLYNPASFKILRKWLEIYNSDKPFTGEEYLHEASKISPELCNFLIEQNLIEDWNKILSNSKDNRQRKLQKQRWFDGFKTLKLIHYLRDTKFPLMDMFDALDILLNLFGLPEIKRRESIPGIDIQKKYLQTLRKFQKNDN